MAFQGSLKELPLPDIIQLVSVSGKTGMFVLEGSDSSGRIYLREGQIVHAEAGDLSGEEAIYELAIWKEGDFVFTPGEETDRDTIQKSNTNLLMEAARRIDEWQVLSKRISSTRLVPVFTEQATATSVSLTPQEWALICKIDERRTIDEIAVVLSTSAFEVCKLIYGLVTSGLVALTEDLKQLGTERLRQMTPDELIGLAEGVHEQAKSLLNGHGKQAELDGALRMSRTELQGGRGVDAILDLVRAEEKLVASVLGPAQSKGFLSHFEKLLSTS